MKAVATLPTAVASDRVAGFDLLRGICALAVAAYHVLSETSGFYLHTWGTFAVYIFFVLSGASMWIAYVDRFAAGLPVTRFLQLRLIRLAPLYLAVLALVLAMQIYGHRLEVEKAFLNIVFQFGLGNPGDMSLLKGGWSLGIEFVFYLLFPVCLAVVSGRWWWVALLIAFASQHLFVGNVLGKGTLATNWNTYTQPLSFVFYFLAGCVVGRATHAGWIRPHWIGLPVLVGSIAIIGATSGETDVQTLIGFPGMALSLACAVAVAAAAAVRFGPAGHYISEHLGTASYGVYLLHPIVFYFMAKFLSGQALAVATLGGSFGLALLLHWCYEVPVQEYLKHR